MKDNKNKLAKLLMITILLLVPAFSGCFGTPVSESSESDIPLNGIKIEPYVTVAYIDYNGWWDEGQTDTFCWLDIRNICRSNQASLECIIQDMPAGWSIHEITKRCDFGTAEFNSKTNTIKVLYAQHTTHSNVDTLVNEEWHTEYETTIRLRVRINCGEKGGWDLDGDGDADTFQPNENGVQVGTFARAEPYDLTFYVSNDYSDADIKLQVYVFDDPNFSYTPNHDHPYRD